MKIPKQFDDAKALCRRLAARSALAASVDESIRLTALADEEHDWHHGFLSIFPHSVIEAEDDVFVVSKDRADVGKILKEAGYTPSRGKGGLIGCPELSALFEEQDLPAGDENAHMGARLRRFRKARRLNTADAGEVLGLSPRTLEGIEQGRGFTNATILSLALDRLELTMPASD